MKTRSSLLFCAAALATAAMPAHAQLPTPTPTPGYVDAFKPSASNTLAERQARTVARVGQRMVGGEAQLLQHFRGLYQEVWRNPDGLTPQQVCDGLGTKAGSLFVIAGTLANALYQIDPAGLGNMISVPAGYNATIHADGTVTITYTVPTPVR